MYKKTVFLTLCLFLMVSGETFSSINSNLDETSVPGLENLRPDHPRLFFTYEDQQRIEKQAPGDGQLQMIIDNVIARADRYLEDDVVIYTAEEPRPRLLHQSRAALARIHVLSMAYRMTSDEAYLNRALLEMETAAAFPDWNPRHFLDVGEMTAAFAIGYDWLYQDLTDEQRSMIRQAIVTHGLKPGIAAYENDAVWVRRRPSNWNQVCNAGLIMGALVVIDDEPELAKEVLAHAYKSAPLGMHTYAPDGAYQEGPMYWWYGTAFNVLMIDALQTALGTDWGLSDNKGFDATATFPIHAASPIQRMFNYGDSSDNVNVTPMFFWFARQYENNQWAEYHRNMLVHAIENEQDDRFTRLMAFDIAWYVPPGEVQMEMPLDVLFRGEGDLAVMRSSWNDPDALYVAFQGIWNQVPHAQLDHGSFVLDADGVRWALHLGTDSYSLPDFWDYEEGGVRWTYYRNSSLSHNTLVIGDNIQRADAKAYITSFKSEPELAHAVLDMSETYEGQAERVSRGIAMLDRSRVLVQDELRLPDDMTTVRWGMVTEADIELKGSKAVLTQDGRTLHADILTPSHASFELVSTDPGDDRQRSNEGTVMLAIKVRPDNDGMLRLAVLFTPAGDHRPEFADQPVIMPLDSW